MHKPAQIDKGLFVVRNHSFVVVGQSSMQNTLLASLLESRLGGRCAVLRIADMRLGKFARGSLALLDAAGLTAGALEEALASLSACVSVRNLAVFNADDGIPVEALLAWPKLCGYFRRDTSETLLIDGLNAILNGELWLPRKMLAAYLAYLRRPHPITTDKGTDLTRMELETLRIMVGGARNADIAKALHLSPHTVKTHIYNLFRKINVSNRVQAVSWALANVNLAEHRPG